MSKPITITLTNPTMVSHGDWCHFRGESCAQCDTAAQELVDSLKIIANPHSSEAVMRSEAKSILDKMADPPKGAKGAKK